MQFLALKVEPGNELWCMETIKLIKEGDTAKILLANQKPAGVARKFDAVAHTRRTVASAIDGRSPTVAD
jgi:hypothetical protein